MPQSTSPSDSALRLAVDVRRLPWIRRLAVDYAFDYEKLAPFFAGPPTSPEAWTSVIRAVQQHERPRQAAAALAIAQHESRGAAPEAIEAARALSDPRTVAVVTGQQAGLFGGPLFTLLKAASAVRLARRTADAHGVPVVAVFWIDADDHDWEEVRTCGVLDQDLVLRSIAAPAPAGAGEQAVGALRWPAEIGRAIEAVSEALPPSEYAAWTRDLLNRAYVPGLSVAESFARLLDQLLGPLGLIVFDGSDPRAKRLAAPIFATELEHPGRTTLAAARAGAELVARGYHMQVTPHANAAALFHLDGGRRPIRFEDGTFVLADGHRVPQADLIARARHEPEGFSPNVLLRPILQDTLFPTCCYIAGPNEIAYLAQLQGIYEAFGLPRPLVQPRASATLVDSGAMRFLTRHQLAVEQIRAQDEHVLNELLRAQLPPSVEQSLADAQREIAVRMEAVIAAMPAVDPTLEGKARAIVGRMEHELSTLHTKVLQAAKRRDETLRRQFLRLRAQAFPQGDPQERAVGGVSFLGRHGPDLVARLLDELPLDGGTHWVVRV